MSRILIVDDDRSLLQLLKRLLQKHGHDVITVTNGFEALEVAGRQRLDLVLLDVEMPGMSGMETLQRLNGVQSRVPVILMTGYEVLPGSTPVASHPPCAVVTKDIPSKALVGLVNSISPSEVQDDKTGQLA